MHRDSLRDTRVFSLLLSSCLVCCSAMGHAQVQVPSVATSTVPPAITLGAGKTAFTVNVRDASGVRIQGSAVVVQFGCTPTFCGTQPPGVTVNASAHTVTAFTDTAGVATFCVCGSVPSGCTASVSADGVLLGSRPAQDFGADRGTRSLTSTESWTGSVTGIPISFTATATGQENTGRIIQDMSGVSPTVASMIKRKKSRISLRCCPFPNGLTGDDEGIYDINGGNWDQLTLYIHDTGETLRVVSRVRAMPASGGVTLNMGVNSVISGSAPSISLSATIVDQPILETWHQAGPGLITMSSTHRFTVDGVQRWMNVQKTMSYSGSAVLPHDEFRLATAIVTTYDAGTGTLHDELTTALVASPAVPSSSKLALGVLVSLIMGSATWIIWRRRSNPPSPVPSS